MSLDDDATASMDEASLAQPQSDEEWRKLLVPQPESNEQLLAIVQENYGVGNIQKVQRLDSYDDANFMLQGADGTKYLLKIHNGVESREYISVSKDAHFYTPGKMSSAIHLQNAIMELCYQHGLCTSRPIAVKVKKHVTGEPLDGLQSVSNKASPVCIARLPVISTDHSPCDLVVRLLTWVEGHPMSSIIHLPLEALADAGRYLGKMDKILDNISASALSGALRHVGSSAALLGESRTSFVMLDSAAHTSKQHHEDHSTSFLSAVAAASRKRTKSLDRLRANLGMEEREGAVLDKSLLLPANRYHVWDTKNTSDLRSYLKFIADSKRRGMVETVIDAFEERLIRSGVANSFRQGLNHGDFNDANILIDETMMVCGAIDFGDSVMSWRVLDVAVAMAYAMLSSYGKQNRSLSAAAGVLRGYNAVYQLSELEREHLPLLMACRLSCSVTLGAYAFHMNPTNRYLLLHAEPAWKTLELLWGYDKEARDKLADAARGLFNQACLYSDPREKIITCYDLVIPDPSVADLLASVRVLNIDSSSEASKKRQRTKGEGLLPTIFFVTTDHKHFMEANRLLRPRADSGAPRLEYHLEKQEMNLQATENDFISIARKRCNEAAEELGGPVVIDVSGLCLTALAGLPGPYTRNFLDACGVVGLAQMASSFEDKSAYGRTVVCFSAGPGCDPVFFEGRSYGLVVPPRGNNGLGFDAIFQPNDGDGRTYAEKSPEEKDLTSHRARAFAQLYTYLHKFRNEISHHI